MSTYSLHSKPRTGSVSRFSAKVVLMLIGFMVGASFALMFILQQIGNIGISQ